MWRGLLMIFNYVCRGNQSNQMEHNEQLESLTHFQHYLRQQLAQLEHSRAIEPLSVQISKVSRLQESIIDGYLFRTKKEKKEVSEKVMEELSKVKEAVKHLEKFMIEVIIKEVLDKQSSIMALTSEAMATISEQAQEAMVSAQNWKQKFNQMHMSHKKLELQNQQLKTHLEEWEQARARRRNKQQQHSHYNSVAQSFDKENQNLEPYGSRTNASINARPPRSSIAAPQQACRETLIKQLGHHRKASRQKLKVLRPY